MIFMVIKFKVQTCLSNTNKTCVLPRYKRYRQRLSQVTTKFQAQECTDKKFKIRI